MATIRTPRMTKMDAVGILYRLKKETKDQIEWVEKKRRDEAKKEISVDPYETSGLAQMKEEIRALEMAGVALTK